ncbi:MAG: geranylgeranylglycerol-phosphate geranylgeranyltransferase [Spirosomataceae bacterium]
MRYIFVFFRLIRYRNLLMIAFTQYFARYFIVGVENSFGEIVTDKNQFLITLATVTIAAAGYVINDYFDVKIDLVNKPKDVIIGRYMKRRWAIVIHQSLSVFGVLLGFFIGWKVFLVNLFAVSLLWFYAERFKRQAFIGNLVVSGLTGASLVVMAVHYTSGDKLLNIYAVFAFFISLIREIIKDMEDIKGDKKFGCQTLPILWGVPKTKQLVWIIMLIFVSVVLSMGFALQNKILLFVFLLLGIPVSWLAYALIKADRKVHFAQLSRLAKWIMLFGISSMAVV